MEEDESKKDMVTWESVRQEHSTLVFQIRLLGIMQFAEKVLTNSSVDKKVKLEAEVLVLNTTIQENIRLLVQLR